MRGLLAALVVMVVAAGTAAAAPKIALTEIDGDDSGDIREAVAEALDGKELSVIGAKETNRAVENLKGGVAKLSEKQAKKLSAELEVDAIVYGSVGKVDGNKILKLHLFVNGKKAKGFSVQFSNPKSKKFKEALHSTMVSRIEGKPIESAKADKKKPKKGEDEEDEEDPIAKKPKKGDKTAKDDKPAKGDKKADKKDDKKADKKKPKGDEEVATKDDKPAKGDKKKPKADQEEEEDLVKKKPKDSEEKPEEDEEETPKKKPAKKVAAKEDGDETEVAVRVRAPAKHAANAVAVRVDMGVSASKRTLSFTTTPELTNKPKGLKQGVVPGARVEGEINPIGFANPRSFVAGIGIAFEYDKALSSKVSDNGISSAVDQQHYLVGLRSRVLLGRTNRAPSLTFGAGYGVRTFKLKSTAMFDLPNTEYKYIAPELGFRIPITNNIALSAIVEAMLVRDAGAIVTNEQYGKAKVFGIDAQPGLDIVIKNRIALRLAFEMTQIGYTFKGVGDLAKNRDSNPDSVDIGGALDRSLGGVATLAVLY